LTNVLEAGELGPVRAQDLSPPGVRLALPDDAHPGSLEAEVEASDA
jgi:hypothetical protein